MLPRWARRLVVIATALVAWLVATPARAAAPLCDQRGATAAAPAPQLQPPTTSIDLGPSPEDECAARLQRMATFEDGRAPAPRAPSVSAESVVVARASVELPTASFASTRDDVVTHGAREGVHLRLDRPPRG